MDPIREDNGVLEISTRFLSDEDVRNAMTIRMNNESITTLIFNQHGTFRGLSTTFFDGFATNPRLTTLKLGYIFIEDDGTRAIATKFPNLTMLKLFWCDVDDDGAKAIATKLPNLTSLDLDYNNVGNEGAIALSKLSNLETLDVWSNSIGDEGAIALLTKLPKLKSLDLRHNNSMRNYDSLYSTFESHPTLFDVWLDDEKRTEAIKNRKRMRAFREVVKSLNDNVTSKIFEFL